MVRLFPGTCVTLPPCLGKPSSPRPTHSYFSVTCMWAAQDQTFTAGYSPQTAVMKDACRLAAATTTYQSQTPSLTGTVARSMDKWTTRVAKHTRGPLGPAAQRQSLQLPAYPR